MNVMQSTSNQTFPRCENSCAVTTCDNVTVNNPTYGEFNAEENEYEVVQNVEKNKPCDEHGLLAEATSAHDDGVCNKLPASEYDNVDSLAAELMRKRNVSKGCQESCAEYGNVDADFNNTLRPEYGNVVADCKMSEADGLATPGEENVYEELETMQDFLKERK